MLGKRFVLEFKSWFIGAICSILESGQRVFVPAFLVSPSAPQTAVACLAVDVGLLSCIVESDVKTGARA